jgi:hypothetical protein
MGGSHFELIALLGATLIAVGALAVMNTFRFGEGLVRLIGQNRPIRMSARRQRCEVSEAELRFFGRAWGAVILTVGIGWLLIGLGVLT